MKKIIGYLSDWYGDYFSIVNDCTIGCSYSDILAAATEKVAAFCRNMGTCPSVVIAEETPEAILRVKFPQYFELLDAYWQTVEPVITKVGVKKYCLEIPEQYALIDHDGRGKGVGSAVIGGQTRIVETEDLLSPSGVWEGTRYDSCRLVGYEVVEIYRVSAVNAEIKILLGNLREQNPELKNHYIKSLLAAEAGWE